MKRTGPLSLHHALEHCPVAASAPCRIDCGGTWDLRPFYMPYHYIAPSTVNIALDIRTTVSLGRFDPGWIRVVSRGFKPEVYESTDAPFSTPLGFVFAIATYFNVTGVEVRIHSSSPPRSALGGSGALGVALIYAFSLALSEFGHPILGCAETVRLASTMEDGLSVSLCGMQDQAAAAYGGVNQWTWRSDGGFARQELATRDDLDGFADHILVAYCGTTHDSIDVNTTWIGDFAGGRHRGVWFEINTVTQQLSEALRLKHWSAAARALSRETDLRRTLTPEVLVGPMESLVLTAEEHSCGARFTGAGGGGCVWALGESSDIARLASVWQDQLSSVEGASLLSSRVASVGMRKEESPLF